MMKYDAMMNYDEFQEFQAKVESLLHDDDLKDVTISGFGFWYYAEGAAPERCKLPITLKVDSKAWTIDLHCFLRESGFAFRGEDL